MKKYIFLVAVYLFAVVSSPVANMLGLDVQNLYRVPVLGQRWIDLAILVILFSFIQNLAVQDKLLHGSKTIVILCSCYLVFQVFQLLRTWKEMDLGWQMAGFLCILNFFILIDFTTYLKDRDKVIHF